MQRSEVREISPLFTEQLQRKGSDGCNEQVLSVEQKVSE